MWYLIDSLSLEVAKNKFVLSIYMSQVLMYHMCGMIDQACETYGHYDKIQRHQFE